MPVRFHRIHRRRHGVTVAYRRADGSIAATQSEYAQHMEVTARTAQRHLIPGLICARMTNLLGYM